jgi:serine/threonine protein kinase
MTGNGFPDDLDFEQTIHIPRFGPGQKIFRRYILQKILGRGGMGVVWLAEDEDLERLVALKVLPETLCHDHASLEALKRETKLGLHLAHPNIVRIYDFQRDDNAAAISMEYVDGVTLSDARSERPEQVFSPSDLQPYVSALCDALNYAHTRRKIVHRDLKPRNLMLNSEGELKIADFGISRSISESMIMVTGKLGSTGSPQYISPQQWDGDRPSPLDDIYSVGATLYELLTSKPPLLGVVDRQQVHSNIPPPMWRRRNDLGITGAATISPEWEETIAACLAKDPKDRPQTILEVQARLANSHAEDSVDEEVVAQDFSDTTIVIPRVPSQLELEVPATPLADSKLTIPAPPFIERKKETTGAVIGPSQIEELPVQAKAQPSLIPALTEESPSTPAQESRSVNPTEPSPPEEFDATPREEVFPETATQPVPQPEMSYPLPRKMPRWIWAAAGAAIFVLCGSFFFWKKQSPPPVTSSVVESPHIQSTPNITRFTLDIDSVGKSPDGKQMFPKHVRAFINGTAVKLKGGDNHWSVDFGAKMPPLPFDLEVSAPGYQSAVLHFEHVDDLKNPSPLRLDREHGNIAFRPNGTSDFTAAQLKMVEALPGQNEDVVVDSSTIVQDLSATTPVVLPTGVYEVAFESGNRNAAKPTMRVAVQAGALQPVDVPKLLPAVAEKAILELLSVPAGAEVFQNGTIIGTTPIRQDHLVPGDTTLLLRKDGYLPRELKIALNANRVLKKEISLAQAAPLYQGTIRIREKNGAPVVPLSIALGPDLKSGTMTQTGRHGNVVVKFAGVWEGAELHATTSNIVSQPAGIHWTPESFILRFEDNGNSASYECVAGGSTYVAELSAQSGAKAEAAAVYKGTIRKQGNSNGGVPLTIRFAPDRNSGTEIQTSKYGDTVVNFRGFWGGKTLRAVTGTVVSKPKNIQWKPESFAVSFADDWRTATYDCTAEGQHFIAELSAQ